MLVTAQNPFLKAAIQVCDALNSLSKHSLAYLLTVGWWCSKQK